MAEEVTRLNVDELYSEGQGKPNIWAPSHVRNAITEHAAEGKTLILTGSGQFDLLPKSRRCRIQYTCIAAAQNGKAPRFNIDPNRDRSFYWVMKILNNNDVELTRRKKPTSKPTLMEGVVLTSSAFITECRITLRGTPDPQTVPSISIRVGVAVPARTYNKGINKMSVVCGLDDNMAFVGRGKNKGKSLPEIVGIPIFNEQEMLQQAKEAIGNLGKE